jgi:hypothetical protein
LWRTGCSCCLLSLLPLCWCSHYCLHCNTSERYSSLSLADSRQAPAPV